MRRFVELWMQHVSSSKAGDLTPPCLLGSEAANGPKALAACQQEFMGQLFADVMSFAGELTLENIPLCVSVHHTTHTSLTAHLDR
jgi:hypothetical protein